jgi:transcriptional regulator with XRE-family HTH domain
MANKQEFDSDGFYKAIERTVRSRKVTWRDVGTETGVSSTTLTRMGQGRRPDAASLAALSAWAGVNPANYIAGQFQRNVEAPTLERVSLLFRQDAQLSDEARKKLESIVESAYNALRGPEPVDDIDKEPLK